MRDKKLFSIQNLLFSVIFSETQTTKKPHNYHKTAVWQKDDLIRKSPLKFYIMIAFSYSKISEDWNLCKPEWGQKKKANVIFPESLISYDIIPYTSYHTSEIPFVFNNIDKADTTIGGGEEAQLLSDRMSQAWINFARTGNPSVEGLPEWEAYTPEGGATMIFDNTVRLVHHHDAKLLDLLLED